jgi:hypothetical protein
MSMGNSSCSSLDSSYRSTKSSRHVNVRHRSPSPSSSTRDHAMVGTDQSMGKSVATMFPTSSQRSNLSPQHHNALEVISPLSLSSSPSGSAGAVEGRRTWMLRQRKEVKDGSNYDNKDMMRMMMMMDIATEPESNNNNNVSQSCNASGDQLGICPPQTPK